MGDFNRHHPLWEDIRNRHLYNYAASQPLIDMLADYGLIQILPKNIPTLQSTSTDNWTRPDNVFGTEQLLEAVVTCDTDPSLRGPYTDHIPIHLTLNLEVMQADSSPRRNWRVVDWEAFNDHLSGLLHQHPPLPLASEDEFQSAACLLTKAIMDTIEQCVPHSKPCPHSKRWWTHNLLQLCGQVKRLSRLSYELRGIPVKDLQLS
jgi:hypothetical protein